MKFSDRIVEAMPGLDKAAAQIQKFWNPLLGPNSPREIKDALAGTWFGHPLHPAVVTLPIGFWTSSLLLDLAGEERAADLTLGAGFLTGWVAAASGAAQWVDATNDKAPRRLGALHASLNGAAAVIYGASWLLRRRGNRAAGVATAVAGYGAVMAGSFLGGDLAFDLGIGVDHAAFESPSKKWTEVATLDDLPDGKPVRVDAKGTPVLLYRDGDEILAVGATCPHLGGPLDEGEIEGDTVTCPWHGSVFALHGGALIHGPATVPVVAYEARVQNGTVAVRAKMA
ncbi:MAG: Rieske 2Fe-2S domain-containing protein [Thermomicrobiales bacterium]